MPRAPLYLLFVAAAGCSCSDGSTPPPDEVAASIQVSPDSVTVSPGETARFEARVRDASQRLLVGYPVTWSVSDPTIASIAGDGTVTGRAVGVTSVSAVAAGRMDTGTIGVTSVPASQGDVQVDAGRRFQTIQGWEATAWASQWACGEGAANEFPAVFDTYQQELLERLVDELGITRIRLEVRAGSENPRDLFGEFRNRLLVYSDISKLWYITVNDNDDPYVMNPAGFHFSELDFNIEKIINPLRQILQARGEPLYVNLNFVQFRPSPYELAEHPEEYAEFMLAAFRHLDQRYGWVPDAIEMILEPDNTVPWNGTTIGRALVATAQRLNDAGYDPEFIAPSTADMGNATNYFDDLVAVPGALQVVDELAYHRYRGVSNGNLTRIGQYAQQYAVRTSMLEHIGSGAWDLHSDLKVGQVSAWAQYAIGGCGTNDPGGRHYLIDVQQNPTNPPVILASRSHFLRQYFRYVRPGAVRVDATSEVGALDPVAFVNLDGKFVVVVKALQARSFSIGGLPAGRYGVVYTTGPDDRNPVQSGVAAPDVTVAAGEPLLTSIPTRGIITIYGK